MKSLMLALLVAGSLVGCSQPKNKLADLKNKEYQKRLAESRQKEGGKGPVIFQNSNNPGSQSQGEQSIPEVILPETPKTPDVASVRSQHSQGENSKTGSTAAPQVVTNPSEAPHVDTSLVEEVRRQPETKNQNSGHKTQTDSKSSDSPTSAQNSKVGPTSDSHDNKTPVGPGSTSNSNESQSAVQTDSVTETNTSPQNQGEQASENDENASNDAFLTFEEYYLLSEVLLKVFEAPEKLKAFTSKIESQNIKLLSTEQTDKKLNLKFGDSGRILGEVQGAYLEPSRGTQAQLGDFKFLGLCTYPDCSTYFFTLHKVENDTVAVNFPMVLKLVKNQYVEAKLHPLEFYQKALQEYTAQQKAKNGQK